MPEIEFSSDIDVKLIRSMASDDTVVQAAQVSVKGENNPETDSPRLISYLKGSNMDRNDAIFVMRTDSGKYVGMWWTYNFSTIPDPNHIHESLQFENLDELLAYYHKSAAVTEHGFRFYVDWEEVAREYKVDNLIEEIKNRFRNLITQEEYEVIGEDGMYDLLNWTVGLFFEVDE